jgi:hypothetical protein
VIQASNILDKVPVTSSNSAIVPFQKLSKLNCPQCPVEPLSNPSSFSEINDFSKVLLFKIFFNLLFRVKLPQNSNFPTTNLRKPSPKPQLSLKSLMFHKVNPFSSPTSKISRLCPKTPPELVFRSFKFVNPLNLPQLMKFTIQRSLVETFGPVKVNKVKVPLQLVEVEVREQAQDIQMTVQEP